MIVDDLFAFEKESGVFDIEDCNGIKLWSIFRYEISDNNNFSFIKNTIDLKKYNRKNILFYKIIKYFISGKLVTLFFRKICYYIDFFRFHFSKHYDYLFFMNGRNVKNGKRFDRNLYDLLQIAGEKKSLIFESSSVITEKNCIGIKWLYKTRPYDFNLYQKFLTKNIESIPVDEEYIEKLYSKIVNYFGNDLINKEILSYTYKRFYCDFNFWTEVLKKHKIKKVFFVSNGILKGFIYAAKKLNIPIYEAQHGNIVREHINYSYPTDIDNLESKVIMPDKILGFSKYWFDNVYCPSENIAIGNNYFAEKAELKENRESMLVIISDIFGHDLCEQLLAVVKEWKGTVIIKLRPGEYDSSDWYKQCFVECNNVKIICGELTITQLLSETKILVTSASTCAWEALNSGIPVIICKLALWESMQDLIGIGGAIFCDKISDINFSKINYSIKPITFFEPLNVELAKQIIKN